MTQKRILHFPVLLLVLSGCIIFSSCREVGADRPVLPQPDSTSALIGLADSVTGMIWKASYEAGNLAEWENGGEVNAKSPSFSESTTQLVQAGNFAMALNLSGADGEEDEWAGIRMKWMAKGWVEKDDFRNLPDEGYYSSYFYIPVAPESEDWELMSWRQAVLGIDGQQSRKTLYRIYGFKEEESGDVLLGLFGHVDGNGNYQEDPIELAFSTAAIPVSTWSHLECKYRWSRFHTGCITCWIDGNLVWNVQNAITELDERFYEYPRQWSVSSLSEESAPSAFSTFVDDAVISLRQVGP